MHWRTLAGPALFVLFAAGCGYSEQEWQAQLSKYQRVDADSRAKDAKLAEITRDLESEKRRVSELRKDLETLGVDLSHKDEQVTSLSSTLEERERALADARARTRQLSEIKERYQALKQKLDDLTKVGLAVSVRNNRMVVSLPGDVVFDSGRETLKKEGKDILRQVAKVVHDDPALAARDYQVTGHTDDKKLAGGPFRDNWGLSLMRAREVLVFLVSEKGGGLPVAHWSAAGYGETDPVAPNDTDDGRKKNRRVEIAVVPSVSEMLDLKSLGE